MYILNIKIDNLSFKEAIEKIEGFIENKKPHQVVTVNPEFIMTAQKDRGFARVLNDADLSCPDGAGIIWAAKKYGQPIKERVTGVDLVWALAKLSSEKNYKMYLLGAGPGITKKAAERIKIVHPDCQIAGAESGGEIGENLKTDQAVIARIKEAKPDILLVAFGAPKQDKWIARYQKELKIPVAIGVGGTFDFIAGSAHRAPLWMRKAGLEWLYRLLTQPWRLGRILTATIRFPWAVLWSKKGEK